MKILYISTRINAPDGSSVHGRAFVKSTRALGHEVVEVPAIRPIRYRRERPAAPGLIGKLRTVNYSSAVKSRIRSLGTWSSQLIDLYDGVKDTISCFAQARRALKQFDADVLIYRSTLFNFAPRLLRRLHKLPSIAEVNAVKAIEGQVGALISWGDKAGLAGSDRAFAVSEAVKSQMAHFYPPEKTAVIPNGVDLDEFDPGRFERAQVKRELGLEGRFVLGYVGSYKGWHGLDLSVDVIAELYRHNPGFCLVLIGNGDGYRPIQTRVENEGLQDCVRQIDYLAHEQVPRHLAAFDVALMTYPDFDGFYFSPLKMYEYMAMRATVVSTATGQIKHIIQHDETGLLVYPPQVDAFVDEILRYHGAPEMQERISAQARSEVEQRHSWLQNAERVVALANEIVGNQDGSRD